jgi:transposase InsO family protein
LLQALERHGEIEVDTQVRDLLLALSPATIDRRLKPFRNRGLRRPYSQSRSATTLKAQIPVRTFSEWQDVAPGSLQADLVMHCGQTTEGFHLATLVAVDVATGWAECEPIWGKGQQRVGTGMHHVRERMPFRVNELHTDNGGEFVNEILYPWCKREGIRFTRGRPYKKNDQAYAEQKNWSVVRRLVGYDRYSTKKSQELMHSLYQSLRQYVNFFQPIRKLIGKERVGAKVRKLYDEAQTPYQRLLASGVLEAPARLALEETYRGLNPAQLRRQVEERLDALWAAADQPRTVERENSRARRETASG